MLPPQLQRKLAGTQEQLEQYRLQLRADQRNTFKKAGLIACVCAACLLAGIALNGATDLETAGIIVIVLAIAGILGALIYALVRANTLSTAYIDAYKTEINNAIVKHFSPALSYNENDGIGAAVFVASHLFSAAPDRYATSDLVSGAHGKTHLKFARVHAEQKHTERSGKTTRTYYTTIFKGVLLVADFNKNFRGHTYVRTDIAERALGHFGRTLQKLSTALSSDQLVQLENPGFEKEFAVYTSDQVEARYILSPALMERMLELKRRSGTEMQFSFRDSSVIISIARGTELFAPDFARPATDAAQLGEVHDQLAFFIGIVDDLDLNTRLWSKE